MNNKTKIIVISLSALAAITGAYFGIQAYIRTRNYKKIVSKNQAEDIINKAAEKIKESDIDYKSLGVNEDEDLPTGVMLGNEDDEKRQAVLINNQIYVWYDDTGWYENENGYFDYENNALTIGDSTTQPKNVVYGTIDNEGNFTYN